MIPGMSGQGNSIQGGDAGPATTGNQSVSPNTGAQSFNFNAPSAGFFGGGQTGAIIKGVVVVIALLTTAVVVSKVMKKGK